MFECFADAGAECSTEAWVLFAGGYVCTFLSTFGSSYFCQYRKGTQKLLRSNAEKIASPKGTNPQRPLLPPPVLGWRYGVGNEDSPPRLFEHARPPGAVVDVEVLHAQDSVDEVGEVKALEQAHPESK